MHPTSVGFSCITEFHDRVYLMCYSRAPGRLLPPVRSIAGSAETPVSVLAVQMYFMANLAKGSVVGSSLRRKRA